MNALENSLSRKNNKLKTILRDFVHILGTQTWIIH
jgi:hypothetical protein